MTLVEFLKNRLYKKNMARYSNGINIQYYADYDLFEIVINNGFNFNVIHYYPNKEIKTKVDAYRYILGNKIDEFKILLVITNDIEKVMDCFDAAIDFNIKGHPIHDKDGFELLQYSRDLSYYKYAIRANKPYEKDGHIDPKTALEFLNVGYRKIIRHPEWDVWFINIPRKYQEISHALSLYLTSITDSIKIAYIGHGNDYDYYERYEKESYFELQKDFINILADWNPEINKIHRIKIFRSLYQIFNDCTYPIEEKDMKVLRTNRWINPYSEDVPF